MSQQPLFENPFRIEDLMVFDDEMLRRILIDGSYGITLEHLACSVCGVSTALVERILRNLSPERRLLLTQLLQRTYTDEQVAAARKHILDQLFWELTYWKTPELYDALTEGEQIHPGIFQQLASDLRGSTVLDAGAGCGRASFGCLRYGACRIYAVEPSPGLLRILRRKINQHAAEHRILPLEGRFDALPLEDQSVDLALSCSAFTAAPEQGGEPGLRELKRVTKTHGKIVLIWPRREDRLWLEAHGFNYVTLPVEQEMSVRFSSLHDALLCARRFYAHNPAVAHYLLTTRQLEVPFSVIGINPPCDYCWLEVRREVV